MRAIPAQIIMQLSEEEKQAFNKVKDILQDFCNTNTDPCTCGEHCENCPLNVEGSVVDCYLTYYNELLHRLNLRL